MDKRACREMQGNAQAHTARENELAGWSGRAWGRGRAHLQGNAQAHTQPAGGSRESCRGRGGGCYFPAFRRHGTS